MGINHGRSRGPLRSWSACLASTWQCLGGLADPTWLAGRCLPVTRMAGLPVDTRDGLGSPFSYGGALIDTKPIASGMSDCTRRIPRADPRAAPLQLTML